MRETQARADAVFSLQALSPCTQHAFPTNDDPPHWGDPRRTQLLAFSLDPHLTGTLFPQLSGQLLQVCDLIVLIDNFHTDQSFHHILQTDKPMVEPYSSCTMANCNFSLSIC